MNVNTNTSTITYESKQRSLVHDYPFQTPRSYPFQIPRSSPFQNPSPYSFWNSKVLPFLDSKFLPFSDFAIYGGILCKVHMFLRSVVNNGVLLPGQTSTTLVRWPTQLVSLLNIPNQMSALIEAWTRDQYASLKTKVVSIWPIRPLYMKTEGLLQGNVMVHSKPFEEL